MKMMIIILGTIAALQTQAGISYTGSRTSDLWEQVKSDEYKLPNNKVSLFKIGGIIGKKIKRAANRTLADRSDLLPQFDKLAHPNGVCLKGTWKIDRESKYSGYFKKGSEAQIIARASTALSATTRGNFRGFGFAGKLFPTSDFLHSSPLKTANFFLVDDLGGTKAKNYNSVEMTNEPKVSKTMAVIMKLAYSLKLAVTFGKADSNPGIRQLYEISELGLSSEDNVTTPKWMKVGARKDQLVDERDFRSELDINNYSGSLIFDISVASTVSKSGKKNWKRIGTINFSDSVVSNSCDHRLHFHHPKWKSNLTH